MRLAKCVHVNHKERKQKSVTGHYPVCQRTNENSQSRRKKFSNIPANKFYHSLFALPRKISISTECITWVTAA